MQMNEATEQAAVSAAEKWLALIDAGDFEESWEQTASLFKSGISEKHFFKSGISKQQWQSSLKTAQHSLGKAVLRRLKSRLYTEELPWEPDAEYAVIDYETTFERQPKRTETVILMKESDGEWRVSGYNFKLGTSNKLLHGTAR
jgi:hypothetical protein